MPEQNNRDFWLYVGLVISGLLNLTGMASIVDGLVTWAHFFREIIDVYRTVIREPLAYVGNHLWPFGQIPHWAFDVFVLWSALFLALNIFALKSSRETAWLLVRRAYRDGGLTDGFLGAIVLTIFLPIALILLFSGVIAADASEKAYQRGNVKGVLENFLLILAVFVVILFINWQLKKYT
jgi:hypothetical protein